MDEKVFKKLRSSVEHLGIRVCRYEERSFGSWLIELESEIPVRIVWDGRDGWLGISANVGRTGTKEDPWRNVWTATSADERTPEYLVKKIQEILARDLRTEIALWDRQVSDLAGD